jgi:transglutaminase-like putative cysteine protease
LHFQILHESLYRYDVPVALGSHLLRLTPRATEVRLSSQSLVIEPEPSTWSHEIDVFGNAVTRVNFIGTTERLRIESQLVLDTSSPLPLIAQLPQLPLLPPPWDELAAYRHSVVHPSVQHFAESLSSQVGRDPIRYLDHLTRTLHARIEHQVRASGNAYAAELTLESGRGACRDTTRLFLDACRCLGLPGRFASGYQAQAQTPDGQRHLHAWAEIFLPGIGWSGWDATHGVRVGEGHVALCAAPSQAATMPIEGGFFFQGAVVNSTLDHSVRITTS